MNPALPRLKQAANPVDTDNLSGTRSTHEVVRACRSGEMEVDDG
jgi:hypothetical protein